MSRVQGTKFVVKGGYYWPMESCFSELCIDASHFLWIKPLSRRHFTRQLITQHACRSYLWRPVTGKIYAFCTAHRYLKENPHGPKMASHGSSKHEGGSARKTSNKQYINLQNSNSARAARLFGQRFFIVTARAQREISRCMVDANLRRRFSDFWTIGSDVYSW